MLHVTTAKISDRGQWLALRTKAATASDAGCLFGVHPWKTIYGLYHEKRGELEPQAENGRMRRGREIEPIVATHLQEAFPEWQVTDPKVFLYEPESRLGATPDRYVRDSDGKFADCQIKTVTNLEWRKKWRDNMPPEFILLQVLAEMRLCDSDYGLVVPFDVDAWELHDPIRVDRYPEVEDEIARRALAFMQRVDRGEKPTPDFARDAGTIAALYRPAEGKTIDLRSDNFAPEQCKRYLLLGDEIDTLTSERKAVVAALQSKMGDAETALIAGFEVNFKTINRRAYTVKASSYRRLTVEPSD